MEAIQLLTLAFLSANIKIYPLTYITLQRYSELEPQIQ
jgi:hypothetical protein